MKILIQKIQEMSMMKTDAQLLSPSEGESNWVHWLQIIVYVRNTTITLPYRNDEVCKGLHGRYCYKDHFPFENTNAVQ